MPPSQGTEKLCARPLRLSKAIDLSMCPLLWRHDTDRAGPASG